MPFWAYALIVIVDVIGLFVAGSIVHGAVTQWKALDTFRRLLGVTLPILLVVVIVIGTLIDLRVLPTPGA